MKVPVEIYSLGGIDCLSEDCPYTSACANHCTAGDFRSEDGFTPELEIFLQGAFCKTADRPSNNVIDYRTLPSNYDDLTHGALIFNKETGEVELI